MVELFANNRDPDQMLHSAVPDLGLHCLQITLSGVSRLQWVKTSTSPGTRVTFSISIVCVYVTHLQPFD